MTKRPASKNQLKKELDRLYRLQDLFVDNVVHDYVKVVAAKEVFEGIIEQVANKDIRPIDAGAWWKKWNDAFSDTTTTPQEKAIRLQIPNLSSDVRKKKNEFFKKINRFLFENYSEVLSFNGSKKPSSRAIQGKIEYINEAYFPEIKGFFVENYRREELKKFLLEKLLGRLQRLELTQGETALWFQRWCELGESPVDESNIGSFGFVVDDLIGFELQDSSFDTVEKIFDLSGKDLTGVQVA